MSFEAQPRRQAPAPKEQGFALSPATITIIAVIAVIGVVLLAASFWTEILWFTQTGFREILFTQWGTRAVLFLIGFVVMGAILYSSLKLAYAKRPIYAPSTPEQATLEQYREAIEPLRKILTFGIPIAVGAFAGLTLQAQWSTVQLALNSVDFGTTDPEFGLDYSFYVFLLPVLQFVTTFLLAALVISFIGAAFTHYLYGGVTLAQNGRGGSVSKTARIQLAVLAALVMLVLAAKYFLDRYTLLLQNGDRFDGATYTDVNAVIPAKTILAGVAVLVAILFIFAAIKGNWKLPAIGIGLMVLSSLVVGSLYPWFVQRFQVTPNAQSMEAPFIQRNIDATREAFGLDNIEVSPYAATTEAEANALRADAETTASIRLLDPNVVSPSFRQLQQNRGYYNFAENLSVDRYIIDGESRDSVIAVRELDLTGLNNDQRSWVNEHTVYTHGYGVVAAYGNQIREDGRPAFYEGSIPTEGALTDLSDEGYEPRIYFSTKAPAYSIVGAEEGADPVELDYPTDSGSGQVNYSFPTNDVEVGPSVGNTWNKLLYAIKFQDEEILFSSSLNDNSQIIYDRDPATRVEKVAPFLTLDNRVYPAVVDGRVKWIIDGYTTTNNMPYSTSAALDEATATITAANGELIQLLPQEVNYIRNSVKATVDAYSGEVTLYAWDDTDPILKAWQKVFPDAVKPITEISSELMSHIRYPEDMFKVQRTLLTKYHVTTAQEFYSGQDFWRNPSDPAVTGENPPAQPPYYQTLQMPGQEDPAFSLSTSFIAGGSGDRNVLTGYLSVNAEAGDQAGVKGDEYGKMRLLELPRGSIIPGPGQVQNNFDSDTEIATAIGLLKNNANVTNGNLLTLPVGGGLLYVQPVYVEAKEGTKFPLLRKVLVAFGNEVELADTLDEALDRVFKGESGVDTDSTTKPDDEIVVEEPDTGSTDGGTDTGTDPAPIAPAPTEPETPSGELSTVDAALQDAKKAMEDASAALAEGDFAKYGEAQERLQKAVEAAIAAEDAAAE